MSSLNIMESTGDVLSMIEVLTGIGYISQWVVTDACATAFCVKWISEEISPPLTLRDACPPT